MRTSGLVLGFVAWWPPGPPFGGLWGKSLTIKYVLLWLGRFLAADKRRSQLLVAYLQRCVAPLQVVLLVGSASTFGHNGSDARDVCKFSKSLFFITLVRFCKTGAPPKETHVGSVGVSLGGSRVPFGEPSSAKSRQLSEVICSGSGGCSRRVGTH